MFLPPQYPAFWEMFFDEHQLKLGWIDLFSNLVFALLSERLQVVVARD